MNKKNRSSSATASNRSNTISTVTRSNSHSSLVRAVQHEVVRQSTSPEAGSDRTNQQRQNHDPEAQSTRIKVCARLRPITGQDKELANTKRATPEVCVHLKRDGQTIRLSRDQFSHKTFRVDYSFDALSKQAEVYRSSFRSIVAEVIRGYNGTGMCYGQTGSGKTWTMFGSANYNNRPGQSPQRQETVGLAQMAIEDVFKAVEFHQERGLVANVFVTFYQLYMEQAYDLLVGKAPMVAIEKKKAFTSSSSLTSSPSRDVGRNPEQACKPLILRDDPLKGVYLEGLKQVHVECTADAVAVMEEGLANREVHSTQYNIRSSRSHAVFQLHLEFEEQLTEEEQRKAFSKRRKRVTAGSSSNEWSDDSNEVDKDSDDESSLISAERHAAEEETRYSVRRRVLTLVDLAGSERVQTYHVKSQRQMKEAALINKSIAALGNCIQALASSALLQKSKYPDAPSRYGSTGAPIHVPFRDCKLTRLLANALGGNSKTCIIVTFGPCAYNYEETNSTLKFALRAMAVKKSVKKETIKHVRILPEKSNELTNSGASEEEKLSVNDYVFEDPLEMELPAPPNPPVESWRSYSYNLKSSSRQPSSAPSTPSYRRPLGVDVQRDSSISRDEYSARAGTLMNPSSRTPDTVRFNLGEFLRACQSNPGVVPSLQPVNIGDDPRSQDTQSSKKQLRTPSATVSYIEDSFIAAEEAEAFYTDTTPLTTSVNRTPLGSGMNNSIPLTTSTAGTVDTLSPIFSPQDMDLLPRAYQQPPPLKSSMSPVRTLRQTVLLPSSGTPDQDHDHAVTDGHVQQFHAYGERKMISPPKEVIHSTPTAAEDHHESDYCGIDSYFSPTSQQSESKGEEYFSQNDGVLDATVADGKQNISLETDTAPVPTATHRSSKIAAAVAAANAGTVKVVGPYAFQRSHRHPTPLQTAKIMKEIRNTTALQHLQETNEVQPVAKSTIVEPSLKTIIQVNPSQSSIINAANEVTNNKGIEEEGYNQTVMMQQISEVDQYEPEPQALAPPTPESVPVLPLSMVTKQEHETLPQQLLSSTTSDEIVNMTTVSSVDSADDGIASIPFTPEAITVAVSDGSVNNNGEGTSSEKKKKKKKKVHKVKGKRASIVINALENHEHIPDITDPDILAKFLAQQELDDGDEMSRRRSSYRQSVTFAQLQQGENVEQLLRKGTPFAPLPSAVKEKPVRPSVVALEAPILSIKKDDSQLQMQQRIPAPLHELSSAPLSENVPQCVPQFHQEAPPGVPGVTKLPQEMISLASIEKVEEEFAKIIPISEGAKPALRNGVTQPPVQLSRGGSRAASPAPSIDSNALQSNLLSMVHELRAQLQKKDEEINTLKTFILKY